VAEEEEEVARRDRDEVVEDGSEFLGFDDAITFDDAISGETCMFFSFRFFSFALVFYLYFEFGDLFWFGFVSGRFWGLGFVILLGTGRLTQRRE